MSHPTADKNFRLSLEVLPERYAVSLRVEPAARTFSGKTSIDLKLAAPQPELILHGIDLEVARAIYRYGSQTAEAQVEAAPTSETLILKFPAELPRGGGKLEIEWSGEFTKGLRGLYASGDIAATQFEAADARRLFPCFDEPRFKATWALTLDVPAGLAALSNGAVMEMREDNGRQRIVFTETPPLSTYLIALVVGKLASTPGQTVREVPVRTWAQPEKIHLAAFGQDVALNVLPRLEDYFGLPYAFGKLDQVGIPDFEAGAMENAGLITYREVALLLDPATAALNVKKRVAEVVTHELAHQWFGNWVTMVWWDDLWLNEAFATWMSYKIVDAWKPEWRVWLDFDASKAAALQLDAMATTHPVRSDVHNAGEATENFDAITYEKGGAVLRMIEGYLGEARFRDGIRNYMRKFARANAVADDLWSCLGEASGQPVLQLANAWIRQPGFPRVSLSRTGRQVKLTQERFFSAPGAKGDERWPVPLVLRFADAAGVHEQRVLLEGATMDVELAGSGEISWLNGNAGATGFYRVDYDAASLAALRQNLGAQQAAERVALLADQWALVRSGHSPIGPFLDLALSFGNEEDYAVLDELVGRLSVIEHRLVADADRPQLATLIAKLLGPSLVQLGWDARSSESDAKRLRRAALLRGVGLVAREATVGREASARVTKLLAGDGEALEANLQDAAVVMAARTGDGARFDALQKKFEGERDPAFRRRYLMSLAAFEEPTLVARSVGLLLSETVPLQDFAGFVTTLLGNRAARESAWALVQERWAEIETRTGNAPMLFRRVIEAMGALPERKHYEAVQAFLQAHPNEGAKAAIAQTLERMRQDAELRERTQSAIGAWLKARPTGS